MKTYKQLLDHCKSASGWKYVYGAKGKVTSRSQILQLQTRYGKALVWDSDLSKAGSVCSDCSGLISSCTGIVRNSANYKSTAVEVATLAQLKANWKKYIGWGIWKNGHIGVVSDTEGYYYAMDGSSRNWVHYPISKNDWTCVIKLKDIDYSSNIASTTSSTTTNTTTTVQNDSVNVYYRAYAGTWYSEVENCNDTSASGYAGVHNKSVSGLCVRSSKGQVKTRVHLASTNKYLPWVSGYNINDGDNGYAGILGKDIDGIQLELSNCPGYSIMYRVSLVGSSTYLPWVNGTTDYAGIYGKSIDKIQIKIVKN